MKKLALLPPQPGRWPRVRWLHQPKPEAASVPALRAVSSLAR
jgi:hypothetical protein